MSCTSGLFKGLNVKSEADKYQQREKIKSSQQTNNRKETFLVKQGTYIMYSLSLLDISCREGFEEHLYKLTIN